MNLLFLDSIEAETYGGMEEWIRLVAEGLAARGHSVTVAGRPGSEFLRRVEASTTGVEILPITLSGDFNPATITRLKKFLAAARVDLISVNFNKDVRLGGIAARLEGSVRVVWSVGLDITKNSLIHRVLTPRLVDRVLVPSESLKRQITRAGYIAPAIVDVIPIGIGDAPSVSQSAAVELRRRFDLPEDSVVAVTSGRFVEQKGHRYLVEAARDIVAAHDQLRFVWLGDGPLEGELRRMINTAGLNEYFVLAGMVDSVEAVLAGADLMIHPSVEEPFGIAVLEGMRAGLPVVASEVGGLPEVVAAGVTAQLAPPREPALLAEAVNGLLATPDVCRQMGQAGRERWRNLFTLDSMIDRVEKQFEGCVSASGCANG